MLVAVNNRLFWKMGKPPSFVPASPRGLVFPVSPPLVSSSWTLVSQNVGLSPRDARERRAVGGPSQAAGAFLLFVFRGFQITGVSSSIQHSMALQPLSVVVSVRAPTAGKLGPVWQKREGTGWQLRPRSLTEMATVDSPRGS